MTKFNRNQTALSRRSTEQKIKIDFENVEKLANYNNRDYAYKREALEIFTEGKAVNDMEHAAVDERSHNMIRRKQREQASRKKEEELGKEVALDDHFAFRHR